MESFRLESRIPAAPLPNVLEEVSQHVSDATNCFALRLEGPFQAWGTVSQFNRRTTGLMPSKSGVLGLLCAAQGLERGSAEEADFLAAFVSIPMLVVAVPRTYKRNDAKGGILEVSRMQDYHTVQHTVRAGGGIKDCHLSYRQYLQDASFVVLFTGKAVLLEKLAESLKSPVWGVFLGRKACIPTAPVYVGLALKAAPCFFGSERGVSVCTRWVSPAGRERIGCCIRRSWR